MKVLVVPLFATFDALLGAMGGDVGQCLPDTSLGRAKHDYLIAGGALGGDAAWLLECVPKEDPTSALPWALYDALGQRALTTLASLAVSLGLAALTLLP
jgi:hypothetical protein